MTTTERKISDDLLQAFDSIVEQGATLPIEELKKRYRESKTFGEYNEHQLYRTLIDLPVTVDMVLGKNSGPVGKILEGLRELHGDDLDFVLNGRSDVTLRVRKWRDEQTLRKLWREFAEDEYKSKTVTGGA
ncbi:hypothetical protein ACQPXB_36135 [Amycolatopsis sp. CA-161197]|uniref:hypothetical protein n=1 Tax=Amycolatopsis sp. CA-161197 TaxID=3239922 RepID=UPI003D917ADA